MYYNVRKTLSHNCLFNFVVGARGVGKTFSCKEYAINKFLKTGEQFIYVRRFKTELKRIKQFFADIQYKYDVELSCDGKNFYIDGKLAGYVLPLSTSKIEKSTAFPLVSTIIFDEFILDNGSYHYLPDEVINFLEMYETIARMRDVRVIFISNAITFANPYFSYFKLKNITGKEYQRNGDILLHIVNAEEFANAKKETRFAKIIKGTSYSAYAIDNDFLRDNSTFIENKTPKSEYYFTVKCYDHTYGVWIDYQFGKIFVTNAIDPTYRLRYAFTTPDHEENTMILNARDNKIQVFKKAFTDGNIRFETHQIKADILKVFGFRRGL